jgi:hypothetical protein
MQRRQAQLERADWGAALVCSVIANVHRDPKKRQRPYAPDDFLPRRRRRGDLNSHEVTRRLEALTMMLGGDDRRRKR